MESAKDSRQSELIKWGTVGNTKTELKLLHRTMSNCSTQNTSRPTLSNFIESSPKYMQRKGIECRDE